MGKWLDDPVVEDDPRWLLEMADGSVYVDADVSVTEADYRRMYNGYVCPWCYQVLDHAFERTCAAWCHGGPDVTVEAWREYLDTRFGGEKWIGPSRETLAAEQNEMDDFKRKTGIWVPGRNGQE